MFSAGLSKAPLLKPGRILKLSLSLIPKKWSEFQHYKDRSPPWIKLHRELLNNREFMCLPLASKALAPLLWLLASESKDGSFDASTAELAFRLRLTESEVEQGLKPLISKGFFLDASTMLAPRLQDATPETEGEGEAETKEAKASSSPAKLPPCPHTEIIDLFAKHLPELPQAKPEMWTGARAKALAARWKWLLTAKKRNGDSYATNREEALAWMGRYFAYVAESDFLTGRNGKFSSCDLGWLVNEGNFAKVLQGNYDNKEKVAA